MIDWPGIRLGGNGDLVVFIRLGLVVVRYLLNAYLAPRPRSGAVLPGVVLEQS